MMTLTSDDKRRNFLQWLDRENLSRFEAAKKAGISPSALYNFLSGRSSSLSADVLQKLAAATGATVDDILTGADPHEFSAAIITHRIGFGGSMFPVENFEDAARVELPPGFAPGHALGAAIIDEGGLHPLPDGWAVFYEVGETPAQDLIGAICAVRYSGGGDRLFVRTILEGSEDGMHTLRALDGGETRNVRVLKAHRVVSIGVPSYL